jgi:alpha-L-rhamnosidase
VFIEAACFFVDARHFYRKWLADVRDGQDAGGSGQFPQFAPVIMGGFDGGPAWSDAGERKVAT